MDNRFYVHPGGDLTKGISGLSGVISKIGDQKKKEAASKQQEIVNQEAFQAINSMDPNKIRGFMAKNPKMAQTIKGIIETKFPGNSKQIYTDSLFSAAIDINQAPQALEAMRKQFSIDGLDEQEIKKLDYLESAIETNPEEAKKIFEGEMALLADDKLWKKYQDIKKQPEDKRFKGLTPGYEEYLRVNNLESSPAAFEAYNKSKAKQEESKDTLKTYSIKNTDGSTRTVKNVKPGSIQEKQLLQTGFVEGTQTVGVKPSAKERAQERMNLQTDNFTKFANEDPNEFYEKYDYRQNDDGSLFIDPVTGGPQKLKSFGDVFGKRGNLVAIVGLGEQWDDAKELTELLEVPSVQEDLKKAESEGFWDQAKSKWNNSINKWMQDKGIKGDSATATAIARIQRMASDERKKFMGTAVTDSELRSALAWMPNAGDSFDSVMNKTRLMGKEAEQEFRRWLSIGEDAGADMSPFSKSFGIKRYTNLKF
jgi:hypothetical protein